MNRMFAEYLEDTFAEEDLWDDIALHGALDQSEHVVKRKFANNAHCWVPRMPTNQRLGVQKGKLGLEARKVNIHTFASTHISHIPSTPSSSSYPPPLPRRLPFPRLRLPCLPPLPLRILHPPRPLLLAQPDLLHVRGLVEVEPVAAIIAATVIVVAALAREAARAPTKALPPLLDLLQAPPARVQLNGAREHTPETQAGCGIDLSRRAPTLSVRKNKTFDL